MMLREGLVTIILREVPIRIEDGTVPMMFEYPPADGKGRVGFLSKELLREYCALAQLICYRHKQSIEYNKLFHRKFLARDYILGPLYDLISDATADIEKLVSSIVHCIAEIDAVGGPGSFYIPDELKPYLVGRCTKYQVPSGSLWYLAGPSYYIEELYPATPEKNDTYAYLAYCVNRAKYYAECGNKEKLNEFEEYVISCYIRTREDIIQSMPTELRAEVDKIVSANRRFERRLQAKRYEDADPQPKRDEEEVDPDMQLKRGDEEEDPNLQRTRDEEEEEENSESILCGSESDLQNDGMKQKLAKELEEREHRSVRKDEVLQQQQKNNNNKKKLLEKDEGQELPEKKNLKKLVDPQPKRGEEEVNPDMQLERGDEEEDPNQLTRDEEEEEEDSEAILCGSESDMQNDGMKQKLAKELEEREHRSARKDEVLQQQQKLLEKDEGQELPENKKSRRKLVDNTNMKKRTKAEKEMLQQEQQELELLKQQQELELLKRQQELKLKGKDKPSKKGDSHPKRRRKQGRDKQKQEMLEENDKPAKQKQENENCQMQKEDSRDIKKMTKSERQELQQKKLKEKKAACPWLHTDAEEEDL
ncbi:unnamed protein product [Urochloa humidicola]